MLTLAQIEEVKKMEKITFRIGLAKIAKVDAFQDDDGKPVGYAKVQMGANTVTICGTPGDMDKLQPFMGKLVAIEGELYTETKKTGLKVAFVIEKVVEVK